MKALFIGRFQPFHKGHLQVIKKASKEYDEIIIGFGSSQYSNTFENPFSADERKRMIEDSLKEESIKNYRIILIPDIHNPPKWVDHVVSICSDFDVVLSNNQFTKELFSEKGYTVRDTPFYQKEKFSGKEIRRRIINNEPWEDFVPSSVYKLVKDINGVKRLKNI